MLHDARRGLALAAALGDVEHTGSHWAKILSRYMTLKYPLTNQEKFDFAQLLMALVVIPGADVSRVNKIAASAVQLLRKTVPEPGMVLPWRPLLASIRTAVFKKSRSPAFSREVAMDVLALAAEARRFFDEDAASGMWDELGPLLCPHDASLFEAACLLGLLLPTARGDVPRWLPMALRVLNYVPFNGQWDLVWMSLLSRAAYDQPALDWEPIMPEVFTRLLRAIGIQVGTSPPRAPHGDKLPAVCMVFLSESLNMIASSARLIAYALQPGGGTLQHLRGFLAVTANFFHPSNTGDWSSRLAQFMLTLVETVLERLLREERPEWHGAPDRRLPRSVAEEVVTMVVPLACMALFGRSSRLASSATHALSIMAWIAPHIVFPQLLPQLQSGLEAVHETHQAGAALECLAACVAPLLQSGYAEGAMSLMDLLDAVLPGLDPNDPRKTQATSLFISVLLCIVPLGDSSQLDLPPAVAPLTKNEQRVRARTPELADWSLRVMRRIFDILVERSATAKHNSVERITDGSLLRVARRLFQQMDAPLHQRAAHQLAELVQNSFAPDAAKGIGKLVGSCVSARPDASLALFVKPCLTRLARRAEASPAEIVHYGSLLAYAVVESGPAVLPFIAEITEIIQLCLEQTEVRAFRVGTRLLCKTLRCLTSVYTMDYRAAPLEVFDSAQYRALHVRHWSHHHDAADIRPLWHEPGAEETAVGRSLYTRFLESVLVPLEALGAADQQTAPVAMPYGGAQRAMEVLRAVLRGAPMWTAPAFETYPTLPADADLVLPRLLLPAAGDGDDSAPIVRIAPLCDIRPAAALHERVANALSAAVSVWFRTDDIQALVIVCKCAQTLLTRLGPKPSYAAELSGAVRMGKSLLCNALAATVPRPTLLARVRLAHWRRVFLSVQSAARSPAGDRLIHLLVDMATCSFSRLRAKAQRVLVSVWNSYARVSNDVLPRVLPLLSDREAASGAVTGATYILTERAVLRTVVTSWKWLGQLLGHVVGAVVHDRPTLQARLYQLFITATQAVYPMALSVPAPPDEAPAAALAVLADGDRSRLEELVALQRQRADGRSAGRRKQVESILGMLCQRLDDPQLHWRYRVAAFGAALILLRPGVRVPPRLAEQTIRGTVHEVAPVRHACIKALSLLLAVAKPPRARRWLDAEPRRIHPADIPQLAPASVSEYAATEFLDKDYSGWNGLPRRPLYDPTQFFPPIADDPASLLGTMQRLLGDAAFQRQLLDLVAEDSRSGATAFSVTMATAVKGVAQLVGLDGMQPLLQRATELAANETERSYHSLAAEVVAGAVRGSKHWHPDTVTRMTQQVVPIVRLALAHTPPDAAADWAAALRYMLPDRDPRRVSWLLDVVGGSLLDRVAVADQARTLKLAYVALGEKGWRSWPRAEAMVSEMSGLLGFPYRQVRVRIARALHVAMGALWNPVRPDGSGGSDPHPAVAAAVERALAALSRARAELNADAAAAPDGSDGGPPSVRPAAESGDGESGADGSDLAKSTVTRMRDTLVSWFRSLFHGGGALFGVRFVPRALGELLAAHEDADRDVVANARSCCGYLAQAPFSADQCEEIVIVVQQLTEQAAWRTRLAVLSFLQVWSVFTMFLRTPQQSRAVEELVVRMLADQSAEVRQAASATLAGLIVMGGSELRTRLLARFLHSALPPAGAGVPTRHSVVLGLGALVAAVPYEVPDWLPSVLKGLAHYIHEPAPLSTTARLVLADFWRTHQDMWHMHKTRFSEEDLDLVRDLVISPSYYA